MDPRLQDFVSRYGLCLQQARRVAHLDCRVYRLRTSTGSGPAQEWALRIYAADRQDAGPIEDELAWLSAAADEGLHVPAPQADTHGAVLQAWPSDEGGAPRHAVLLRWLHGRLHDRGLTPVRLHRVGMLAGRLHHIGNRLAAAGSFKSPRRAWTTDLEPWACGTRAGAHRLDPGLQAVLQPAAARLQSQMQAFNSGPATWGWVHSDLHLWTLLFIRDVAGAIDFSDCGWGHHALDLAACLQYIRHPLAGNFDHRPQYERLRDSLLEGYASVRPLPDDLLKQLPVYLTARLFVTLDWMLEDWPRLDHRAWGPGFLRGAKEALAGYLQG
jgi:Ser/Thr protein kinase RdoA (MazF antagonist)